MQESKEQREEVRAMIHRIKALSTSIKIHAIEVLIKEQPALNTSTGRSRLRQLLDERLDLALAILEEAKAAGTLVFSDVPKP